MHPRYGGPPTSVSGSARGCESGALNRWNPSRLRTLGSLATTRDVGLIIAAQLLVCFSVGMLSPAPLLHVEQRWTASATGQLVRPQGI
jgi:hypothetical protein